LVVRLAGVSCASVPDVACNLNATVPVGVALVVVTVNDCPDPAETVSGDGGFVVAPVGNPNIAIDTVPVNPLAGVTDTVAGPLLLPSVAVKDAGATETVKSAAGGGGEPEPPPHAARTQAGVTYVQKAITCFRLRSRRAAAPPSATFILLSHANDADTANNT
jgi:hypothetical protein